MSNKVKLIDYGDNTKRVSFHCPGCKEVHVVPVDASAHPVWQWNGSVESPTLSPSLLLRTGHYVTNDPDTCWCTYNQEHPDDPAPFTCTICHSFVRDGRIEFLSDCTHKLAGQTVDLPDIEP